MPDTSRLESSSLLSQRSRRWRWAPVGARSSPPPPPLPLPWVVPAVLSTPLSRAPLLARNRLTGTAGCDGSTAGCGPDAAFAGGSGGRANLAGDASVTGCTPSLRRGASVGRGTRGAMSSPRSTRVSCSTQTSHSSADGAMNSHARLCPCNTSMKRVSEGGWCPTCASERKSSRVGCARAPGVSPTSIDVPSAAIVTIAWSHACQDNARNLDSGLGRAQTLCTLPAVRAPFSRSTGRCWDPAPYASASRKVRRPRPVALPPSFDAFEQQQVSSTAKGWSRQGYVSRRRLCRTLQVHTRT